MSQTLRDGRFVLLGLLGEGSQGQTFDGVDKREGRAVAIKRFDVRGARSWKDAELAEREARVLQALSHPKLPRYIDHFEHDGALYLVMEKIEGESLASLRKRGIVLGDEDIERLLADASEVLDYLHGRAPPVIHRDLKPGNVIRRPDGSFAFVDFGSVRDKLRPEGGSTVVGTFGFMAPEQFQGRAKPASDVYAIGATAITMLTGIDPEALPHNGLAIDVRAALQRRARPRLVDALERMLVPDPDTRAARIPALVSEGSAGRAEGAWSSFAFSSNGRAAPWSDAVTEELERQAEVYERRAEEYERRGWMRAARRWRKGAAKWRLAAERQRDVMARKEQRHAARRARWEQRSARWQNGRTGAFHGPGHVPWPIVVLLTIAFSLATVAVSIATQIVVPFVLHVLALVFGRRTLQTAAASVRDAGHVAVEAIAHAQQWLKNGLPFANATASAPPPASSSGPARSVAPGSVPADSTARASVRAPGPRVRVDPLDDVALNENDEEDERDREARRL
jgi:hypothetical protein